MFEERTDASSSPDATGQPFLMQVEDTFAFPTGGIVASGKIVRGTVRVGQEVEIVGLRPDTLRSIVTSIEHIQYKHIEDWLHQYQQGIIGLLFRRLNEGDVQRGQVIATPGTIRSCRIFFADVTFSTDKEAIRQQLDSGLYDTQFHIWSGTVSGALVLLDGMRHVAPGAQIEGVIELDSPVALEVGREFGIGHFAGTGIVTGFFE